MKKITCLLLLIQSGFIMAQKETFTTANGKRIQLNTIINNGLSDTANGEIQLGGVLLKATTLTTTSAYTLAIQGLQTGAATDNVLVVGTDGVLKMVSRASLGGADNLGNHTATESLKMMNNNITGAANTSTQTATIAKGTDNITPQPGYVATSADTAGNIVWKPISTVSGNASIAFFAQSTTQITASNYVPGLNYTYTAPANGNLILQLTMYTWLNGNGNGSGINPIFTNVLIKLYQNGSPVSMGMASPMGASNVGWNPECTTIITRVNVVKGTTYNFKVYFSDYYNHGSLGSAGGTYVQSGLNSPSTLMGTLITD